MFQFDKGRWHALSPLLDEALDLDADARTTWLAELERRDPDLARILERLLKEHDRLRASDFLESSPTNDDTPRPSLAGHQIGPYTLEAPLGIGGMGTVWRARRSDGRFEGHVAVKLLNLALLDRGGDERFRREGTLLARLEHAHIARLLDAGVTPTGQPYLVLEYVDGVRIDRFADERRLNPRERLGLFLQVADAVAYAHANLIVHRDLKPSNILVRPDGQIKLLDFGIGKLLEENSVAPRTVTLPVAQALTPEYAAPEQARGDAVTTATDVYALGVLLYTLLTGRHPTGEGCRTPADHLRALFEQDPSPASAAAAGPKRQDAAERAALRQSSPERLRRMYRGDIDTILVKALEKDPVQRYQTVRAVADDIRRYLRHEPVAARPESAWYRWRKFAARRRLELAAAAAVVLALVAGFGVAVRQAQVSAGERNRALEQLRRAEAVNDLNAFLLSQARSGERPISNADLLARGESIVERRFADDPVLRAHMLLMLSDRYFENQQFEAWRRVLGRAYADARTTHDPVLHAQATCAWAAHLIEEENAEEALRIIGDVQPLVGAREEADVAAYCARLESRAAARTGDLARAVGAGERAVELETGRRAPANRLLSALASLASALTAAREYARANVVYQRTASLSEQQGLERSLEYAVRLNNWSAMLQSAGQHREAVEVSRRAVDTARLADSENGASLTMLSTWASAMTATGDFAGAAAALDEALVKSRAAGSPSRLFNTLGQAVIAATEAGDVPRAARLLLEAKRALTPDSPPLLKGVLEVCGARIALASGNPDDAVEMSRRALASLASASRNQPSLLPTQTFLARSLNASGRFAEALGHAESSLAQARDRLGGFRYSSTVGAALLEQAVAHQGLGQVDAARAEVTQALEHLRQTLGPRSNATQRAERQLAALAGDRR